MACLRYQWQHDDRLCKSIRTLMRRGFELDRQVEPIGEPLAVRRGRVRFLTATEQKELADEFHLLAPNHER